VGMGWNPTGTQWDSFGHFQKFARNPRSPLGILGIHWDSTGKGGSVISTGIVSPIIGMKFWIHPWMTSMIHVMESCLPYSYTGHLGPLWSLFLQV
jgi:hypothetical protein